MPPAELDEIILRVTHYAEYLIKRKTKWIPRGALPRGYDGGSLAMEALTRVLDGRRQWNPDVEPDLLPYLKSVVKSILSELLEVAKRERAEIPSVGRDGTDLTEHVPAEDQVAEDGEEQLKERLLAALDDDEDKLVLMNIFDGRAKPAEIAEDLGLHVDDVYRIKRKILRRLEKLDYGA